MVGLEQSGWSWRIPGELSTEILEGTWGSLGVVSKGLVISSGAGGSGWRGTGSGDLLTFVWSGTSSSSRGGGTVGRLVMTFEGGTA